MYRVECFIEINDESVSNKKEVKKDIPISTLSKEQKDNLLRLGLSAFYKKDVKIV